MNQDNSLSDEPSCDFFRELCENSAVAMLAADSQFNITFFNRAAGNLLGFDSDSMVGKPIQDAVPPERRRLFQRLLERTVNKQQTSQFEIPLASDDGMKYLMVVLSPIFSEGEQFKGISAWIIDETKNRQLLERLAMSQRMVAVGAMAGGIAHHFNNILGGIATSADLARASGNFSNMQKALQITCDGIDRATKITQALLCFAERDPKCETPADLTEIVIGFSKLAEKSLSVKNITLNLDIRPVPVFTVDANRTQQMLANLLSNAIDSMPDGGTITISIEQHQEHIILTFSDTGCGMKPADRELMFQPFFTTKGTLAGKAGDHPGLGLAIVHGLVADMKGTIIVDSILNEGTTLKISFPINRN